jgi:FtsH-binding integral membrane protein
MIAQFAESTLLIVVVLFGGMLFMQAVGRRLGERDRQREPEGKLSGGAAEAAVVTLLGLLLGFTFSGAGARFDVRRNLVVQETNAIGTAWLRIDLLPEARQQQVKELFRKYVDARIETYRAVPDMKAVAAATAQAKSLQQQIWSTSVAGAVETRNTPAFTLLLPALNSMIEITTTRTAAIQIHPPLAIYIMFGMIALVAAMFAGYGASDRKTSNRVHRFGFAAVVTIAVYIIVDFDYPRLGLIRVTSMDQMMVDLRQSMN